MWGNRSNSTRVSRSKWAVAAPRCAAAPASTAEKLMACQMYITGSTWVAALEVDVDTSTVVFALSCCLIVAAGWIFGS
ncbi:uncharacterized protein M421DRAFT_333057 [Didymella exigua CBS 183.55]|uniref:Uncharacterized protein n=1 Tax=Didymella exigua CBS 183.55 TaxID=1150837 RepID=A0A6A5R4Q2_9PLEO|nr:uncharacterized protein M421DRAFT_333057 [Didymella exigua CBS 183.55]KAF1923081.1 hypothetical protein M421DRAFT_333057 [Didymella exigua CBS 183.55]